MPDHNNCCCLTKPAGLFAGHWEENNVLFLFPCTWFLRWGRRPMDRSSRLPPITATANEKKLRGDGPAELAAMAADVAIVDETSHWQHLLLIVAYRTKQLKNRKMRRWRAFFGYCRMQKKGRSFFSLCDRVVSNQGHAKQILAYYLWCDYSKSDLGVHLRIVYRHKTDGHLKQ